MKNKPIPMHELSNGAQSAMSAAAPYMLEALEAMVTQFNNPRWTAGECLANLKLARDAIERATRTTVKTKRG